MLRNIEELKVDDDCGVDERPNGVRKTGWKVLISSFLKPAYEMNPVIPGKENHSSIPYKVEPNS